MKINAGKHRSRTLITPKNNDVRPTSDKTRQAIFNILNSRGLVVDAVALDAFCGTGALGLEALSQGAIQAYFFDKSKDAIRLVEQNVIALKEEETSQIFQKDIRNISTRKELNPLATLIFLDPPYDKGLVTEAIYALMDNDWVREDAVFVIETSKNEIVNCPLINVVLEKVYGDTKIILAELK